MKSRDKSPSQLLDHIGDIIQEREKKDLPTFYTISIEQFGKMTPVAEKESGFENFKAQILKYTSDYDLTAIQIQLYSGKSRNVKNPFQHFMVQLKKQNVKTIVLGEAEKDQSDIQQLESSIPVHRYYDEKFDYQMRIMRLETDKQNLMDRMLQLTEKYEDKLKDQEDKNMVKIKELEQEIIDLENEIKEFEQELVNNEKAKHNSFGNIALGSVGSRIVENLAKSDMGIGVLKGLLGNAGYETLQGHLAGIEQEKQALPENQKSRVIIEDEVKSPRKVALGFIQKIGEQLPDMYLRMLYDITEMTSKNVSDLQVLWNLSQQIQKQRSTENDKTTTSSDQSQSEESDEDPSDKID